MPKRKVILKLEHFCFVINIYITGLKSVKMYSGYNSKFFFNPIQIPSIVSFHLSPKVFFFTVSVFLFYFLLFPGQRNTTVLTKILLECSIHRKKKICIECTLIKVKIFILCLHFDIFLICLGLNENLF